MANFSKYLMTSVKGACMGAADVIPGVSGGTIAFMTGIYEELIGSINSINAKAVKLFFSGRFREFWQHINGNFLISVFAGILFSILSLAKLMQYLLTNHPIQTWAFFFGLIVASSIFILKGISGWKAEDVVTLVFGIVLGVVICTLSPTETPDGLWFIFISGAIAICAMILPGISGSFILLILGKYEYIMSALADLTSGVFGKNILILAIFAIGAITGILAFSRFLHWLLSKYHRATLLVLAGFIIGSLVKVWPWSNMEAIVRSQYPAEAIIPGSGIAEIIGQAGGVDYHIWGAVIFAVIGFSLITGIELAGKAMAKSKKDK